jgi:hypothetical protein
MAPFFTGITRAIGGAGFGKQSLIRKIPIDYLVLGGGGGGAGSFPPGPNWNGLPGAGAGGYVALSAEIPVGTSFTITVGNGGNGGSFGSGSPGGDSSLVSPGIAPVTAFGGGSPGGSGGSGGGGGGAGYNYPGPTQQGYPGGNPGPPVGPGDRGTGGGGGGAGGAGGNGVTDGAAGPGGIGKAWLDGVTYARGGDGSGWSYATPGTPQPANSGNGGPAGGGQKNNPVPFGGNGGPGIVIIRYPSAYSNASSISGTYTLTPSGGFYYYKFTGPGTITL